MRALTLTQRLSNVCSQAHALSLPGTLENLGDGMHYSRIAYATTATCAAVVDDSSMRFSALCSAVPQVPASASRSASKSGWRPLPNASLDRRLCRNCRLGSACLAEFDDANISFHESKLTGAPFESLRSKFRVVLLAYASMIVQVTIVVTTSVQSNSSQACCCLSSAAPRLPGSNYKDQ